MRVFLSFFPSFFILEDVNDQRPMWQKPFAAHFNIIMKMIRPRMTTKGKMQKLAYNEIAAGSVRNECVADIKVARDAK